MGGSPESGEVDLSAEMQEAVRGRIEELRGEIEGDPERSNTLIDETDQSDKMKIRIAARDLLNALDTTKPSADRLTLLLGEAFDVRFRN